MKTLCMIAVALCAASALDAGAQETLGRVRGVYVQAAPGVLVERSLTRAGGPQWADVELASVPQGERPRVLAQLPRQLAARPGDLVALQLAGPRTEAVPLQSVSRVTEIRSSALAGNP